MSEKILLIVHCVDTEGPLNETLEATFQRLKSMFGIELAPTKENLELVQSGSSDFHGQEKTIAKVFAPEFLNYKRNWSEIEAMLDDILSQDFRNEMLDDFGQGWIFSWHCMDHIGFIENPRQKDFGYGNIFNWYSKKLQDTGSLQDEINWHFHPLSLTRNPTHSASSYINSFDVLNQIICRRIIEEGWFPVVNRPGFHTERPDSHFFLEHWIPFDYANQFTDLDDLQPDLQRGRFGDWSRSPASWRGYHPSHDDYQMRGQCKRLIMRCLNVGTRHRLLRAEHVHEAFKEAEESGMAVLAFADHDFRDMKPDITYIRNLVSSIKSQYPEVKIKFAGAESAVKEVFDLGSKENLVLGLELIDNRLLVQVLKGEIFGPQPFLALKTKTGQYFHDNFDVIHPDTSWSYVLDEQTVPLEAIYSIGVGSAGRYGGYDVKRINF